MGEAVVGERLAGYIACQGGNYLRDANGRLTGVTSLDGTAAVHRFELDYIAADTFQVFVGGAAGSRFDPAEKATPPIAAYDYFRDAGDEFELYRTSAAKELNFATIGRYSGGSLCFYAAGGPGVWNGPPPPAGDIQFQGISDGIAQVGGTTYRLLDSPASATLSFVGSGLVALRIQLRGRQPAFGEISGSPFTELGSVNGSSSGINSLGEGTLSLSGSGYGGRATFKLSKSQPNSIVAVFWLQHASGHRVAGSVALDRQ